MARTKTAAANYQAVTLRFPKDVLESFRACAEQEDRSLNEQVVHVMKNHLKQRKERAHGGIHDKG